MPANGSVVWIHYFVFLTWLLILPLVRKVLCLGLIFHLSLGHGEWTGRKGTVHILHMMNFMKCLILRAYFFCLVYWSCQFIARASNVSLKHWQQMGGVNIKEDIVIDKSIHEYINSQSAVLKVNFLLFLPFSLIDVMSLIFLWKSIASYQQLGFKL